MAGETFIVSVTIANQGNQGIILDLTLEDRKNVVQSWCSSPHTSIALEINQSREVIFQLSIPRDTLPQVYSYALKLDAPRHYQDQFPKFYDGKIRVLPPIEEIRDISEPSFTIQPLTQSDHPLEVQGGELIPFTVTINNRSHQVDRFYLNCRDFPNDWFEVVYPDPATNEGTITSGDGLELNPQQSGQIQLYLTLPTTTQAGRYSPTLQIISANYGDDLALFDLIHLKVPEIYQFDLQLVTKVGSVITEKGWYEIRLNNLGNAPRQLQLEIIDTDGDRLCQYLLDRTEVHIQPQQQDIINLQVIPPAAWKRPFAGRVFNFTIEIRDLQKLPLPVSQIPAFLQWKPRPWWHLYLLILTILLLLAGLIGLAWWLITRKPPQPQVISFSPQNTLYDAVNNQVIRLNWQISHPQQLAQLQLKGVSSSQPDQILSQPISYDFSQGIPDSLQEFCSVGQTLLCNNVPTDAFRAGDYQFQLTLIPQGRSSRSLPPVKTSTISIIPIPKPTLSDFAAVNPTYEAGGQEGVKLNWTIDNFRFVKQLTLAVNSTNPQQQLKKLPILFQFNPQANNPIPPKLQAYCQTNQTQLVCYDVPTRINQVGKFVFQLTLDSLYNPPHSSVSLSTNPIEVTAKPVPIEIIQFDLDGQPASPSYKINLQNKNFITLDWRIKGDQTLQVELSPVPGTVNPSGTIVYPLASEPTTATITLTATDAQGQKKSRSVIIETFLPPALPTLEKPLDVVPPLEQNGNNGEDKTSVVEKKAPSPGPKNNGGEINLSPPKLTDPQFR